MILHFTLNGEEKTMEVPGESVFWILSEKTCT